MTEIRKYFDGERPKCRFRSTKDSVTQQHFKSECDINNIIARYNRTGVLVDPLAVNQGRVPSFGDFSNIPDMMTAQNKMAEARDMFMSLPAQLRKQFGNDPAQFMDYCASASYDQLVEIGIAPKLFYDKEGKEYFVREGKANYTGKTKQTEPQPTE